MNDGFGSEIPPAHRPHALRPAARYLVLIESGGSMVARLFTRERVQVAEIDGSTEESSQMTRGLRASQNAGDAAWDAALMGHSAQEREQAQVFELAI